MLSLYNTSVKRYDLLVAAEARPMPNHSNAQPAKHTKHMHTDVIRAYVTTVYVIHTIHAT